VRLLLDTHVALWWASEFEKVSPQVKAMLLDNQHMKYLSMASAWEIAIKSSIRKVFVDGGIEEFLAKMKNSPITIIPITESHLKIVETLPFIHRDPFDRLLVATAKADDMTILTADANIQKYDVPFVW
jgi:PIN domain nuclease of toxin-antitoxin system